MDRSDVFRKLKLDKTKKILIVNAPGEFTGILQDLTYDRDYDESASNSYDFVQVFGTTQPELEDFVSKVATAGKYDCMFWICYPKGGGKIKSDLKRDNVWKIFDIACLRPVAQVAIDDTWSAMRGRPHELVGK